MLSVYQTTERTTHYFSTFDLQKVSVVDVWVSKEYNEKW